MNIPLLEPSAVTFLTTFRCTAACENCCFQCSPHPSRSMTFSEMKKYLDICLEKYPHIKLVVFSGGECTLLKQDLTDMISYASSMGIRTRIVTNAWWAKSYRDATIKIKLLKAAGLDEINFSTGDEHQEWVPFRYVRNAAVAAIRKGLLCAINVETKDNSKFDIDATLRKDKVLLSLSKFNEEQCSNKKNELKIHIEKGIWAPIKQNHKDNITYEQYKESIVKKRCDNLFSIIPINPYGEVLACCGITCESNPYLRLGNINKEDIRHIYERAFNDVLKLWLYSEGPASIASFINGKNGKCVIPVEPSHACILCREIFRNPEYIDLLRSNVNDFLPRIIIKYCLLNSKSKKREK